MGELPEEAQRSVGGGEATAAEAMVPKKRINSQQDLELFTGSRLCQQLMSFTGELAEAVKGVSQSPERLQAASPVVRALTELLNELERWADDFPPLQQPMRFGNRAFRQWHERLAERAESLLLDVLNQGAQVAS